MKRLLPILGIFLITIIVTDIWFRAKKDRECKSELKERCTDKPIEDIVGYAGRNPFEVLDGGPAIDEKIDEFENSTTWKYDICSSNALPYRYEDRICNNLLTSKRSAQIDIVCTKYFDNSGKFELRFRPANKLDFSGKSFAYVDVKFDDNQPESESVREFGWFVNAEDLIKKLDKHSTLQIRYPDYWYGTQTTKFELNKDKLFSEILKKCSWAKN